MIAYIKNLIRSLVLTGAVLCTSIVNAQGPAGPTSAAPARKPQHKGVLVGGHGTQTSAFESIVMDVFDMLGENRVQVANYGLQKVDEQRVIGFIPLPELIEMVSEIGASSLLYIKVTPGLTERAATVFFQCFDASGHLLWEDKASDVLVDGGNTIFHRNGWKKKLATHIGGPGLSLKAETTASDGWVPSPPQHPKH